MKESESEEQRDETEGQLHREGVNVMALRIGFVSTRLAGTDGVSLETAKWAEILQEDGHEIFYMAGELDSPPERSFLMPECHFSHPAILEISKDCFSSSTRAPETTLLIEHIKDQIKLQLRAFIAQFDLDLIIPENALTIPMNLPLGLALTELAVESDFPMIAHHHDFFWERKRFLVNGCWDYLNKAFPPKLPMIQHTVLNSSQDNQLSLRSGISPCVIPNVMDFDTPPEPIRDGVAAALRNKLGLEENEKLILQPTRIVKRKGIEHAIEFVHRLGIPAKLAISHASGDEGDDYAERVMEYSQLLGVEVLLCADIIDPAPGADTADGKSTFSLSDIYQTADFVTYPSLIEGFGNALLETIYYRRPFMVNNYGIYHFDIKPKGITAVEMDDYVSTNTIEHAVRILNNPEEADAMTEKNYELARKHFSYALLRQKLRVLLANQFGN